MSKETISASKVRKSNHETPNLATASDKDIRIVKILSKKDVIAPTKVDPFSTWSMPQQEDGYLKSTHKDCL